jgi:hypothetical protein
MRGVMIVVMLGVLGGCAPNYAVYDAQRMIAAQVYATPCAAIKQTVVTYLANNDQHVTVDDGAAIETAWKEQRGSTYRHRHLVQFIETDAPSCRVVSQRGVRSPYVSRDGGESDRVTRAYHLEREVMRLHDPEAYARLPVVEFW